MSLGSLQLLSVTPLVRREVLLKVPLVSRCLLLVPVYSRSLSPSS
jgi:hypothetical protein